MKLTFFLENRFYDRKESSLTKYYCIRSKLTVFQKFIVFAFKKTWKEVIKMSKYWSLKETWTSHKSVFLSKDIPLQKTLGKVKKSSKFRQVQKTLTCAFWYFWSTYAKHIFLSVGENEYCVMSPVLMLIFPYFPRS